MSMHEKAILIDHLEQRVLDRIAELKDALKDIVDARDSESKSSAGDKYETGRAMMQIAQNQNEKQILEQNKILKQIQSIQKDKILNRIQVGALVSANTTKFFVAVGLGKITVSSNHYYAISPSSPIGRALLWKEKGDKFEFKGKEYEILAIY